MEVLFWDKVLEKSIVHMNVKTCFKTTYIYEDKTKESGFEVILYSGELVFYPVEGFNFLGCAN